MGRGLFPVVLRIKPDLGAGQEGPRHAHATVFLSAGTNPKVVSERLGHSNIAITLDIYSHVLPTLQKDL